jgi:hypothetical protein
MQRWHVMCIVGGACATWHLGASFSQTAAVLGSKDTMIHISCVRVMHTWATLYLALERIMQCVRAMSSSKPPPV